MLRLGKKAETTRIDPRRNKLREKLECRFHEEGFPADQPGVSTLRTSRSGSTGERGERCGTIAEGRKDATNVQRGQDA